MIADCMERVILWTALAFCGFCLWLLLRHDWLRWTRLTREAQATVVGQGAHWGDNGRMYSARLRFQAEGRIYEVVDQLYASKPQLADGAQCRVTWPDGRPDLARIPRPWMWSSVYCILLYLFVILSGKLTGIIE